MRTSSRPMTWPKGRNPSAVSGSACTVRLLVTRRIYRVSVMDVRSIEQVAPVVEHNGTVPVWWLVEPREMKEITEGGFLGLVSDHASIRCFCFAVGVRDAGPVDYTTH